MASIAKALPRLYVWQFVSVVLGLATQVLLARVLGPHDKGILDLFILIPTVLSSITDFGLLPANTYFGAKKISPLKTLHSNSVAWILSLVAILGGGCWVWHLAGESPLTSLPADVFTLAVLSTGPLLYVALWGGLMFGSDKAESVYVVQGLGAVLQLGIYGLIFLLHGSLATVVYATAVIFLGKGTLALAIYYRYQPREFAPNKEVLYKSMKYGIALFVGIVVNILHNRLIQFIVEAYLGLTALGWYAIAVRMVEMIWLLDYVVINASLFKLTSSTFDESVKLTMQLTRFVGAIVISGALVMAITFPWVIPLLLGERFRPSVIPALLMLPGIVAWSLGRSMAPFVSYQIGKPWYNTGVSAVAFVINLVASVILVPRFGINGAAAASTISYVSMFVLMTIVFKKTALVSLGSILRIQREDVDLFMEQARRLLTSLRKST
jgi:O-antigen/teichoic acid export membrane protein